MAYLGVIGSAIKGSFLPTEEGEGRTGIDYPYIGPNKSVTTAVFYDRTFSGLASGLGVPGTGGGITIF